MSKASAIKQFCLICSSVEAKYSCPRCGLLYCSLSCYKSGAHSQCSEDFYKESVEQELASTNYNIEQKKEFMKILNKMRQPMMDHSEDGNLSDEDISDDDEDDGANDLERRLAGVDLDDTEELSKCLNHEELKEFSELVESGKITQLLPTWIPWWEDPSVEKPNLATNVPSLSSLLKTEPSPNMAAIVCNVIMAYQFTARCLRGEFHFLCDLASKLISNFSSTLRGNAAVCAGCKTFDDALELFETDVLKNEVVLNYVYNREEVLKDRKLLFGQGTTSILLALSDIQVIFKESLDRLKTKGRCSTSETLSKSELSKALNKITFYLAWSKEATDRTWDGHNIIEIIDDSEDIE